MKKISIIILILIVSASIFLPLTEAAQAVLQEKGLSSSLSHLKLKGTLFTSSLNPLAIIEDTRNGQAAVYEIGDIVEGGFKISDINRGQVSFETAQGELRLSFPAGAVWQLKDSPLAGGENAYNIRREGDLFIVDGAAVLGVIRNIKVIMKNVRLSPYFMDGKPAGLTVNRLTAQGILKEIGVREGDVIRSVNGLSLNTPYQIFSAYHNLKNQQELRVDIIRDSRPLVLTYQIRN